MNGYDYEPVDNSPYLKLKSKGDKVKIRLASRPIHFQETFEEEGEEPKVSEKFAWIVINKDTGDVKVYKAGVMIYKKIKDLALDSEWGDPTTYDITITRTEEKGNYYVLVPSPNKSEITKEEKQRISDANLDLERLFKTTDKGTKTFGRKQEVEPPFSDDEINSALGTDEK